MSRCCSTSGSAWRGVNTPAKCPGAWHCLWRPAAPTTAWHAPMWPAKIGVPLKVSQFTLPFATPNSQQRAFGGANRRIGCYWQPGNLNDPIRVLQLKEPLALRYSLVNQNVQSSTGSTVIAL